MTSARAVRLRTVAVSVVLMGIITACQAGTTTSTSTDAEPATRSLNSGAALLVVGDWGSGTESQRQVAAQMADYARSNQVAAIVTTGDNFYSDNADQLIEPFEWATDREVPFVISWGNHDVETPRRIDVVNEAFGDPPRWWSLDWGSTDILILDSNQVHSPQQRQFLVDEMAKSDDPTILVFHHAPLSCGVHGDDADVLSEWIPLVDDDVILVLSGHEHNYQRFMADNVTYVVTGGGGGTLTDLAPCADDHPPLIAGKSANNFVAIELDDSLSITALDSEGEVIDQFSLDLP